MADRSTLLPAGLDEPEWAEVQRRVRRLEAALRSGENPDIETLLPSADDPLRQPTLVELIKFDQEFRWRQGKPAALEQYLARWPELESNEQSLDDLLEAECLTRAMYGDVPPAAEVAARFPEHPAALDLLGLLREAAEPPPPAPAVAAPRPSPVVRPPHVAKRRPRAWLVCEAAAIALLVAALVLLLRG